MAEYKSAADAMVDVIMEQEASSLTDQRATGPTLNDPDAYTDFTALLEASERIQHLLEKCPEVPKRTSFKLLKQKAHSKTGVVSNPASPQGSQTALNQEQTARRSLFYARQHSSTCLSMDEVAAVDNVLSIHPWYIGPRSREEAEELLAPCDAGTLAVRRSLEDNSFVLSVVQTGNAPLVHITIAYDTNAKVYRTAPEKGFASIDALVTYCVEHGAELAERILGHTNAQLHTFYPSLDQSVLTEVHL